MRTVSLVEEVDFLGREIVECVIGGSRIAGMCLLMPKIDDLIRSHDKVGADKAFPQSPQYSGRKQQLQWHPLSTVHDNLANQHYYVHISPIQILASRVIIDDGIYM